MFRLTRREIEKITGSRSQFVTLKRGQNVKYLPFAFTEYGAIMAANVLNSHRAVKMSVFVVRAFVRLRQMVTTHKEIASKLNQLEQQVATRDSHIRSFFAAIRQLMAPAEEKGRKIGFLVEEKAGRYGRA
ncbi:MAG: ORF6N domain-containing protein [Candidatus Binatia bacterium]